MKKRLQGLVAGLLIGAMCIGVPVFAKTAQETISAVYKNIKIVIDGIEVTPKDVNGNVVEPFIYNGTTYLPVRAVGEAFGKDVSWDGATSTVYIGKVEKPAKEVYLYDKSYMDCDNGFKAGKNDSIFGTKCQNYVGFRLNGGTWIGRNNYEFTNSVTYSLNGLAKKAKGTFLPFDNGYGSSGEYTVSFYDENDELLYESPIMSVSVSPVDFEFDTGEALTLKVVFSARYYSSEGANCIINNFAIYTTDY